MPVAGNWGATHSIHHSPICRSARSCYRVIKSFFYPCRFGIGASPAAADEVGGDDLGGAGEEGLGESWEVLGGRGGYGSAFVRLC